MAGNGIPQRAAWRSPWSLGLFLAALLAALAVLSASSGYIAFTAADILAVLKGKILGTPIPLGDNLVMALWDVRLPRLATALMAGASLGLSGAVFQGLLLNPLADPYTLGVSSGAASLTLGAVIALARDREGHLSPTHLILAGVIVSAILSAAISFMKYLAGDQVSSIVFWLLGSFQAKTWADAAIVAVFFAPAFLAAMWSAVDLNIMTQGDRSADTLGVDTRRTRLRLLAAASLAASAAVSVAGIIGFVGLIVPHLTRLVGGPDHRALLPLSALGGAVLLLAADTAVRVALPGEIPVGVLTALLAGPVFLVIFRRRLGSLP